MADRRNPIPQRRTKPRFVKHDFEVIAAIFNAETQDLLDEDTVEGEVVRALARVANRLADHFEEANPPLPELMRTGFNRAKFLEECGFDPEYWEGVD